MFNIGLVILGQHSVLTAATFRCWSRIKFLGLKQETVKYGKPRVARPPVEGANGPVQMQRYSRDVLVSSLSSGSCKGPPWKHWEEKEKQEGVERWGEGQKKADGRLHNTSTQGEQVTNGLVTNCHVVSHGERISFFCWQYSQEPNILATEKYELGKRLTGSLRKEKLSGNLS